MAERPDGLACIRQSSSKVPPITPEILHRWERACLDHFHHKKIPENFGHFLPLVLDGSLLRTRDKRTYGWLNFSSAMLLSFSQPFRATTEVSLFCRSSWYLDRFTHVILYL